VEGTFSGFFPLFIFLFLSGFAGLGMGLAILGEVLSPGKIIKISAIYSFLISLLWHIGPWPEFVEINMVFLLIFLLYVVGKFKLFVCAAAAFLGLGFWIAWVWFWEIAGAENIWTGIIPALAVFFLAFWIQRSGRKGGKMCRFNAEKKRSLSLFQLLHFYLLLAVFPELFLWGFVPLILALLFLLWTERKLPGFSLQIYDFLF